MDEYIINKNSWHYRFLKNYREVQEWKLERISNICDYSKMLIGNIGITLLSHLFLFFIVFVMGLFLSHAILGIIFSIIYHVNLIDEIGAFGVAIMIILLALALGSLAIKLLKIVRQKFSNKSNGTEGFFSVVYKSWKDKYCIKVKFED